MGRGGVQVGEGLDAQEAAWGRLGRRGETKDGGRRSIPSTRPHKAPPTHTRTHARTVGQLLQSPIHDPLERQPLVLVLHVHHGELLIQLADGVDGKRHVGGHVLQGAGGQAGRSSRSRRGRYGAGGGGRGSPGRCKRGHHGMHAALRAPQHRPPTWCTHACVVRYQARLNGASPPPKHKHVHAPGPDGQCR